MVITHTTDSQSGLKEAPSNRTQTVPALEKAFLILDYITSSQLPLTAAEIAKHLGLARSSTHNILQSLLHKGVLYKDTDNRFYLGSYLLYWAGKFEQQQAVTRLFQELIHEYDILLAHTITLSTMDWQKGDVVYLACHESPLPLGFSFRIGMRVPAIFSATGKAILSTVAMPTIQAMYASGLPSPITHYGVNDYEALAIELQEITQTRLSLDNGQLREGMYCIGTYIRDASGKAVAGMAVSFLQAEYEQKSQEVATALIAFAQQLESLLGFKAVSGKKG